METDTTRENAKRILADARRKLSKAREDIIRYEAVIALLEDLVKPVPRREGQNNGTGGGENDAPQRTRALQKKWLDIMQFIGRLEDGAGLDRIMAYSDAKGHKLNRDSLRSQMFLYRKRGWLEAVKPGCYRLTDEGRVKCSLNGKPEGVE